MGWTILRRKSYKTGNPKPEEIIELSEWQTYVENDMELCWSEDSPIAEIYKNENEIWVAESRMKHDAYYEINKTGYGNLRFQFFNHYISIDCERQTFKRVNKMREIASDLKANLFKNGVRYTEKKYQKLVEVEQRRLNRKKKNAT